LKSEVRTIAAREKLPSAQRKDSQGICFLGKINYNDFIERYLGKKKDSLWNWKQATSWENIRGTGFTPSASARVSV